MSIYQIVAGPGTGKTYTSVSAGMLLSGVLSSKSGATKEQQIIYTTLTSEIPQSKSIIYLAHTNTNIAQIKSRLPPDTKVQTFHGAGMSALIRMHGYQKPVNNRMDGFIADITGSSFARLPFKDRVAWNGCKKIVSLLKQEWKEPTPDNLIYLKMKYPELLNYTIPEDWQIRCSDLLARSLHPNKCLEYSDMTWLAAKRLRGPMYDTAIVDESQDLGGATFELAIRLARNILCCGDPNQAINAFSGSDEDIFDHILDISDANFPLKTTFRLPPNLITKANRIKPNSVLPGPNKIPGIEENISYTTFIKKLSVLPPLTTTDPPHLNTITIARTNAPLITLALSLQKHGIKSKLANKELPDRLIAQLKHLGINSNLSNLSASLSEHLERTQRRGSSVLTMITQDYNECILQLAATCTSLPELHKQIKQICTPQPNCPHHLFTTIHGAKGLEAENVFILNPPVEHPLANQNPIGRLQETNVKYVAYTRSRANQYYVCQ